MRLAWTTHSSATRRRPASPRSSIATRAPDCASRSGRRAIHRADHVPNMQASSRTGRSAAVCAKDSRSKHASPRPAATPHTPTIRRRCRCSGVAGKSRRADRSKAARASASMPRRARRTTTAHRCTRGPSISRRASCRRSRAAHPEAARAACATLASETACTARTDCTPMYIGMNCTCDPQQLHLPDRDVRSPPVTRLVTGRQHLRARERHPGGFRCHAQRSARSSSRTESRARSRRAARYVSTRVRQQV